MKFIPFFFILALLLNACSLNQRAPASISNIESIKKLEGSIENELTSIIGTSIDVNLLDNDWPAYRAYIEKINSLHHQIDTLSQTDLDLSIDHSISLLNQIGEQLNAQELDAIGFNDSLLRLKELQDSYLQSKINYGQPKDYKRYSAYVKFFNELEALTSKIDSLQVKTLNQKVRALIVKLKNKVIEVANFTKVSIYLAFPSLTMLQRAFISLRKNKNSGFAQGVDDFFKAWAKASKLSYEVEGLDVIKKNNRPDVVNIYVPTHRDANLDGVGVASLELENSAIFGALNLENHPIFGAKNNPLMKPIVNALAKNDSFILAGADEAPIDKFVRLWKEGKVNDTLIFAEGQVSLGNMESRPIREKFSTGFIRELIEKDIPFRLIPVTFQNGSRMLEWNQKIGKLTMEPGEARLKVKVHKPIDQALIKRLYELDTMKDLNSIIRMKWFESLPTNENLLVGQGRVNHLIEKLEEKFFKRKSCHSIIKSFH